ncbi:hypothetical protein D3C76_1654210 [compost metagenome]
MAVSVPNWDTRGAEKLEGISGVQIGPGATALTRMPCSTRFRANERVKETTAPLVEE